MCKPGITTAAEKYTIKLVTHIPGKMANTVVVDVLKMSSVF